MKEFKKKQEVLECKLNPCKFLIETKFLALNLFDYKKKVGVSINSAKKSQQIIVINVCTNKFWVLNLGTLIK